VRTTSEDGANNTDYLEKQIFTLFILIQQHPGCTELIPQHSKAGGKKGLFHLHKDLSTF
jgi:hypothetical protein